MIISGGRVKNYFAIKTPFDFQIAIITTLKEQNRNHGNEETVTIGEEAITGNFFMLELLENMIPSVEQLQKGLDPMRPGAKHK